MTCRVDGGVTHMCVRQGDDICSFLSKEKNCARLKWIATNKKTIPGTGSMVPGCHNSLHSILSWRIVRIMLLLSCPVGIHVLKSIPKRPHPIPPSKPNLNQKTFKRYQDYSSEYSCEEVVHFPFHASEDFIKPSYNTMDFPRTRPLCPSKW